VHVLQRGGRLGSSERGPVRAACSPVTSHPHLDHLGCPRGMVLVSRATARKRFGRLTLLSRRAAEAWSEGTIETVFQVRPFAAGIGLALARGPHRERPRPNGASSFPQGPGAGIGEGLARLGDEAPFVARRTKRELEDPKRLRVSDEAVRSRRCAEGIQAPPARAHDELADAVRWVGVPGGGLGSEPGEDDQEPGSASAQDHSPRSAGVVFERRRSRRAHRESLRSPAFASELALDHSCPRAVAPWRSGANNSSTGVSLGLEER
jgi:hypothetical protein